MKLVVAALAVMGVLAAVGCSTARTLDDVSEDYVKLVLAIGEHDAGYVDAYYGPSDWPDEVKASGKSLDQIVQEGKGLHEEIMAAGPGSDDDMVKLRHTYLARQIEAMLAYVSILQGTKMTFDEESKALYDAVAPTHPDSYFQGAIADLDKMLPGDGTVGERLDAFRSTFVIPTDKLDAVFNAAIDECRARTLKRMELPEGESFVVEYVNDKSWSAYNWYKGNGHSLIQVNTDLPIYISRAIDLACHEGYPGHHVYNALLEKNLARDRGWLEFTVYPLYSPQSLIAEGTANYGIKVAFPHDERMEFERDVLFPLAGLDASQVEKYYDVQAVMTRLGYAGNEAARRYLNGEISREEAEAWLVENALSNPKRAAQRVRFFDNYRSYVINYNLGQDLVRNYVEALGGTADQPDKRWEIFTELLSSPRLPSGL
jgi:hypothetical protein